MTKKYYEALDKNHKIYRFFAKSNAEAMIQARQLHCRSLIRVSYNTLVYKETLLAYKETGY